MCADMSALHLSGGIMHVSLGQLLEIEVRNEYNLKKKNQFRFLPRFMSYVHLIFFLCILWIKKNKNRKASIAAGKWPLLTADPRGIPLY